MQPHTRERWIVPPVALPAVDYVDVGILTTGAAAVSGDMGVSPEPAAVVSAVALLRALRLHRATVVDRAVVGWAGGQDRTRPLAR